MNDQELFKNIDQIAFFDDFSESEKRAFSQMEGLVFNFSKGDYLIREGEVDLSIFVILEGAAAVTKNKAPDLELNKLGRGDIFGDITFLAQIPRTTNVIAKNNLAVLKLDAQKFKSLDPKLVNKFKDQIIILLISRLEGMNDSTVKIKEEFDSLKNTFGGIYKELENLILALSPEKG